jgi:hypothetical protein
MAMAVQTAPHSNLPIVRDVEANAAPAAVVAPPADPLDDFTSGSDDVEVFVMGVPMTDPQILRATQTIFALITVDFFFLCDYLLMSFELGEVQPLVLLLFVLLPATGYFGILNNSAGLLRCFGCLTLTQALMWTLGILIAVTLIVFTRPGENSIHQHSEYLLLFIFHAVSYNVLAYYGCFLASEVEKGAALPSRRRRHNREDYNILGLQVADMRTLQDVQNLFNASWLVFFFMLYFSVALFDHAVASVLKGTFTVALIYTVFVGSWVGMVHGSFFGVKRNDGALLGRAALIGTLFFVAFFTIALSFIFGGGFQYYRQAIFALYVAFAFYWLASHARKLRNKVLEGAKLTRLVTEPSQVQVGTIGGMSGSSALGAVYMDSAPRPMGMEGVVMGRAIATPAPAPAPAPVRAEEQKPGAASASPAAAGWGQKFDTESGQPIPKFDPQTGAQNWGP